MKKTMFFLSIVCILFIASVCNAITITVDLDNASLDELMQIRDLIDGKINSLSNEQDKSIVDESTLKYEEDILNCWDKLLKDYSFKNPDSITINSITFYDGRDYDMAYEFWCDFDISAQNGFGGMNREHFYGTYISLIGYSVTDKSTNLFSYLENEYKGISGVAIDVKYIESKIRK